MYIADIETNGLDPDVIHCAVFKKRNTKEYKIFTPDNISDMKKFINEDMDSCCMHNGIGFDWKVLKKLIGVTNTKPYCDTLLMSRILWPDISYAKYKTKKGVIKTVRGRFSLESWGVRFGLAKQEHESWDQYSEDMLNRCKTDVDITDILMNKIDKEIKMIGFTNYRSVFKMEHMVWKIIEEQADHGWLFDENKAIKMLRWLGEEITKVEKDLDSYLPIRVIKVNNDKVCRAFKKDGTLTRNALLWSQNNYYQIGGDFCKVKFEKIKISSTVQLKDFLLSSGWEPAEYNYKKDGHNKIIKIEGKPVKLSPKIPSSAEDWDEIKRSINIPSIQKISHYKKCIHRRGQIQGWVDRVRGDGRLEAKANTCGTNTTRFTHSNIVNVPKAEKKVFLGEDTRSLFTVPDDKKLLGFDASALEARVQAHYVYIYDKKMSHDLIDGDVHQKNADYFGITRDLAKNAYYAILYGCSAFKFAKMIGANDSEATKKYRSFWDSNPGLKKIKELLEERFKKGKIIWSIDKRPLSIRYKHALVNTLFQSCGSIIMKKCLQILDKKIKLSYIKCSFVGNFHDEFQIEHNPPDSDVLGEMAKQSLLEAGEFFKMNVPMIGEYKIGDNWAETH